MGFEYIVCDSPAGIETGALMAMHFADEALVVTNPEVSSVRDSDRILGMLASKTQARHRRRRADQGAPADHPLQPQPRAPAAQMLSLEDIQDILRIKLIGVIPESETVLQASNQGVPAVHMKGTRRLRGLQGRGATASSGEEKPMRFVDAIQAQLLQARVRRRRVGRNGLIPVLPARREEEDRASVAKERLQIILAHERSWPQAPRPTTCRRCSASWSR